MISHKIQVITYNTFRVTGRLKTVAMKLYIY